MTPHLPFHFIITRSCKNAGKILWWWLDENKIWFQINLPLPNDNGDDQEFSCFFLFLFCFSYIWHESLIYFLFVFRFMEIIFLWQDPGITSEFHMILWSVSFNAYKVTVVGCLMSLFVTLVIRFSALSVTSTISWIFGKFWKITVLK